MELKGTLIACIAVAILSVLLTYNYTSNHYEAVIAKDKIEQVVAAQETTKLVLAKERKNGNIVEGLNAKALEQSKVISNLQNDLYNLRTSNNGLLIKSSNCQSSAGTSNSATNNSDSTTSNTSTGLCELPAVFADTITSAAKAADELMVRAETCKEYVEQVNLQRARLGKE